MKDYADIMHMERPVSAYPKMDLGHRAKLFASFDALRGFDLALLTKRVERELATRITLSDDAQEQLDRKLHMVRPGDKVAVTYFRVEKVIGNLEAGTYVTETGLVEEIDIQTESLFLDHACIPISEIIEIKGDALNMESSGEWEVNTYAGPDQT